MRRQREAEVIYAILFRKTSFLSYFCPMGTILEIVLPANTIRLTCNSQCKRTVMGHLVKSIAKRTRDIITQTRLKQTKIMMMMMI